MGQQKDPLESIKSFTERVDKEIESDIKKLKRTSSLLALMGTIVVVLVVALLVYTLNQRDRERIRNRLIVVAPEARVYKEPATDSKLITTLGIGDELMAMESMPGWYRVVKEDSDGGGEENKGWIQDDQVLDEQTREAKIEVIRNMAAPVRIYDEQTFFNPQISPTYKLEGRFRNLSSVALQNVHLILTFAEKKTVEPEGEGPLTLPADMTESGRETSAPTSEAKSTTEKIIPTLITREEVFFTDKEMPPDSTAPFKFATDVQGKDIEFKQWDILVDNYPVKITIDQNEHDDTGYFKITYTLSNLTDVPLSNIKVTVVFEDPTSSVHYVQTRTVCDTNPLKKGVDRRFDLEGLVEKMDGAELAERPLAWRGVRVRVESIEVYDAVWKADDIGNFTLEAKLRNNTNLPVRDVKIKVNFFDQNRELIDYKFSYFATHTPLVPGEPQTIRFRGTFTRKYQFKSLRVESFR